MAKADQKQTCRSIRGMRRRRGATAVLLAVMLPVVGLVAGMAINFAYMELCRTELYIATDAAARAGGRQFSRTGDQDEAKVAARAAAGLNTIAGDPLQLDDADFVFGEATRASVGNRYSFDPAGLNLNSVQITGRRITGSADGPIPLLMPNLFSISEFESSMTAESTRVEVDVALVLDRSGSMAYASDEPAVYPPIPAAAPEEWWFGDAAPNPSRWRDAIAAVDVFLDELNASPSDEFVGVCTYDTSTTIDQSMTDHFDSISTALDGYTQAFSAGHTDIGGGITEGVNVLAGNTGRQWAAKVIVVLTDGIQTAPNGGTDPENAAQMAADQGITIYTVTFSDEADQATMQRVADIGEGRHFHASNAADLVNVFEVIANSLPTLMTE